MIHRGIALIALSGIQQLAQKLTFRLIWFPFPAAVYYYARSLYRSTYNSLYSNQNLCQAFKFQWLSAVSLGDSLDWKELSAAEITQRVTSKVQPGSIVLFHNAALHTPEALPGIIEALLRDGYSFVPISQIILTGEYTIDHTGRQCPAG